MEEQGEETLEKIHQAIRAEIDRDKEIRGMLNQLEGTSGGAVPRRLGSLRERSPGDTSPEPPPGTPTREEGEFLQSRGEGLPIDRSGGPSQQPQAVPGAARFAEQEIALRRGSQGDPQEGLRGILKGLRAEQERMTLLSGRMESFLIAISMVSAAADPESPVREFCEGFKQAIPKAHELWYLWRNTVNTITGGDLNLIDMRKIVTDWNADPINPRINKQCFRPTWSLWKFGTGNPDATLTVEEKKEFAIALGYTEQEADVMVQGSFPKPSASPAS